MKFLIYAHKNKCIKLAIIWPISFLFCIFGQSHFSVPERPGAEKWAWLGPEGWSLMTWYTGAVEQLRTHVVRLAALYSEDKVQLYERGYGKDPAGERRRGDGGWGVRMIRWLVGEGWEKEVSWLGREWSWWVRGRLDRVGGVGEKWAGWGEEMELVGEGWGIGIASSPSWPLIERWTWRFWV